MNDLESLLAARLLVFIPVLLSLSVHEWAHAWSALKLGDDTAQRLGRVTLNPIAHMDPIGTLLLPLIGFPLGWAKPVPVNPLRLRRDVRMAMGLVLVAAAGPLSNLCIAAASTALLIVFHGGAPGASSSPWIALLHTLLQVNVMLALFNLLPVPPLDGSRIVDAFIPQRLRPFWEAFAGISPLVLIAILFLPHWLGFGIFDSIRGALDRLLVRLAGA